MNYLNWVPDEDFYAKACAVIDRSEIVSFDVFDTALTRVLDSPKDVFSEVEARCQWPGYALIREEAENKARTWAASQGFEDVTFDRILDFLPPEYDRQLARDTELAIENSVLVPVPDIQRLYQYALNRNKRVIFVSDMYLPSSVIQDLLNSHGYTGHSYLYVSAEVGLTKTTGTIWTVVKTAFTGKIVHIGDNGYSDVFVPQQFGIETLYFGRARCENRWGHLGPQSLHYSKSNRHHTLNLRGLGSVTEGQRWHSLGERFMGPLLAKFTHWTSQRLIDLKVDRVYYLAREGSLMYRAAKTVEALPSRIDMRYLEVSRRTVVLAAGWYESDPGHISPHLLSLLTHVDHHTTARQLLERCFLSDLEPLVQFLLSEGIDLDRPLKSQPEGVATYQRGILRHRIHIYGALRAPTARTVLYLQQMGLFDPGLKTAVIDSGWSGSIQRALQVLRRHNGVDSNLHGLYYALWKTAQPNFYAAGPMEGLLASGFEEPRDNPGMSLGVGIIEELHGADIGSVIDYREVHDGVWKPVYQERSDDEIKQYNARIRVLQNAALTYVARTRLQTFLIRSAEEIRAMVDQVLVSPSDDELELLGSLVHAMTYDHSHQQRIAVPWPGSIEAADHHLEFADWHCGVILHWYKTAAEDQKPVVRELARRRLTGYLSDRQLRIYGL